MARAFEPSSPIEHAIVAGEVATVISLFAGLPRAEHATQRSGILRALKAMDATRFKPPEEVTKIWGGPVLPQQERAANAAIAFCGTAKDIADNHFEMEDLVAIGRAHRPPGLVGLGEAILERSLFLISHVQELIAQGLIDRPSSDLYPCALMGLSGRTARHSTLADYMAADPGLKDVLLRIMDVEGTSEFNLAAVDKYNPPDRSWSRMLCDLAARAVYSRSTLHEKTLAALERDWPQFRAGWFSRFHEEFAPTTEEMRPFRSRYLALTRSRIPPTVTLALSVLRQLDAAEPFSAAQWTDALAPVMSSSVKAHVLAALRQMDIVVKRDPSSREAFAAVASTGLSHSAADVQKAVLDRLKGWGVSDELRAALNGYLSDMAAVHRPALQSLLGTPEPRLTQIEAAHVLRAISRGTGPTSPLDPSRRVAEICDYDELIERIAFVFENADDVDEFERALAALVRLGPMPEPLRIRFGPVLKRAGKAAHPLARELARMLRFVFDGVRLDSGVWRDDVRSTMSRGEPFLVARVDALIDAVAAGLRLTPLATPTHLRGFIDPTEFVARLAQHAQAGIQPQVSEAVQALLRLVPGRHEAALRAAMALPDWPVVRGLRYALGDDLDPKGYELHYAAAARIRHPDADDTVLLRVQGDSGPDVARCARYEWHIVSERRQSGSITRLRVTSEPRPTDSARFIATARHLPAHQSSNLFTASRFAGPGPGLVEWAATVIPSNLDALFAEGAEIIGNNLDWWEAQWWSHAYLRPLLDPTVPMTGMAVLLLSLALGAKEPGHSAIAVDAFVQAHREARGTPNIGTTLQRLLEAEWIMASRLAKSLRAALRIEPALAGDVFDLLAETLRMDSAKSPPKDTAKLLELLQETMLTSGRSLPDATRGAISALKIGGQGAKIQKVLLGRS